MRRGSGEYAYANVGGYNIPLDQLPKRLGEIDRTREIVVHCRSGVRSAQAVEFLLANGFTNVRSLAGGILAWSQKIDPTVRQY